MRISNVETYIVRQELDEAEQFSYSQAWYKDRTLLLLRITTDEGFEGWGEAFGPAFPHKETIDKIYGPYLMGKNPLDSEVIWMHLYNIMRDHGQKGLALEAQSAVDIALWDLKGKITGLPVYQLMGGAQREMVLPYATGMYRRRESSCIEDIVREARGYVDAGFSGIKIKTGFGSKYDVETVRAVREEVGEGIMIMVDANHAYNATTAIRVGHQLEELDITWFEEPVPPEDVEGYKEVRRALSIPISGGEAEFTRFGFYRLLHERAVDIVQPDCGVTGGISEFLKIAVLASIHNTQCHPHVWGSGIALNVGLHCCFALPDFPPSLTPGPALLECDRTPNVFREKLNKRALVKNADGYIMKPEGPGLGVEVDMDLIDDTRIA